MQPISRPVVRRESLLVANNISVTISVSADLVFLICYKCQILSHPDRWSVNVAIVGWVSRKRIAPKNGWVISIPHFFQT